jgi:hypothetical protein
MLPIGPDRGPELEAAVDVRDHEVVEVDRHTPGDVLGAEFVLEFGGLGGDRVDEGPKRHPRVRIDVPSDADCLEQAAPGTTSGPATGPRATEPGTGGQ